MVPFDSQWLVLLIVPALLLSFLAQLLVQLGLARGSKRGAKMSGYAAARQLLDGSGLYDVRVEQVPGHLNNHYDPRRGLLQLSPDVYHGRDLSAVGTAAHEAAHAIQQHQRFRLLLRVRNVAVPAASFGSGAGILLALAGLVFRSPPLLAGGVVLFSGAVFLQLVNLPCEFDASWRARRRLLDLGVVHSTELSPVKGVLNAAALTYLAATLQSTFTLVQWAASALGGPRRGV